MRTTDFLFFVSTHHLHRFAKHPIVRRYIEFKRPGDYYHANRAVLESYRLLVPEGVVCHLAPFSLRKGPNVYGVTFGSRHPRGLEKFLSIAWQKNQLNGEADCDIEREDFRDAEPFLDLNLFSKPKKTSLLEAELEKAIRDRKTGILASSRFPVKMRAAPPVTNYAGDGTLNRVKNASDPPLTGTSNVTEEGCLSVLCTGLTAGYPYYWHYTASGEL